MGLYFVGLVNMMLYPKIWINFILYAQYSQKLKLFKIFYANTYIRGFCFKEGYMFKRLHEMKNNGSGFIPNPGKMCLSGCSRVASSFCPMPSPLRPMSSQVSDNGSSEPVSPPRSPNLERLHDVEAASCKDFLRLLTSDDSKAIFSSILSQVSDSSDLETVVSKYQEVVSLSELFDLSSKSVDTGPIDSSTSRNIAKCILKHQFCLDFEKALLDKQRDISGVSDEFSLREIASENTNTLFEFLYLSFGFGCDASQRYAHLTKGVNNFLENLSESNLSELRNNTGDPHQSVVDFIDTSIKDLYSQLNESEGDAAKSLQKTIFLLQCSGNQETYACIAASLQILGEEDGFCYTQSNDRKKSVTIDSSDASFITNLEYTAIDLFKTTVTEVDDLPFKELRVDVNLSSKSDVPEISLYAKDLSGCQIDMLQSHMSHEFRDMYSNIVDPEKQPKQQKQFIKDIPRKLLI